MKIQLQNITFYPATGGIENYLYYASKTMLKMGHEPTILCSQHQPNLPIKEVYEGIKIIRHQYYRLSPIPFAPINQVYYVKKLQKFIKNNSKEYDAIWSRFYYYCYASSKSFQGEIPIIFILAASAPIMLKYESSAFNLIETTYSKIISPQLRFIEKNALEMCDKVVVLSDMRMREISDFYKINRKKIEVIPPGIDTKKFKPMERDKDLLKELKIPENTKVILTVCRLSQEKNVEMLISAYSKINLKNVCLIIVGDGLERPYLEKLTKKLNVETKIKFTGFRKDIGRFYSIADIFVLPSKYEGFGHVFLEAMASGVPCIGLRSDYPNVIVACDEIIRDGRTGYLADPYSIDDLTEKIERVISNVGLRDKFGMASRKICEEEYTWETHVRLMLKQSQKIQ